MDETMTNEPIPTSFATAQANLIRELNRPRARLMRILAVLIHRLFTRRTGPLALIVAVTGLTIGLCL
jgi:hypothetical protein